MLVCLQFESIGRRNASVAGLGLDRCNVLPHLKVSRTTSPLHTRITNAPRRAQSPSGKTACAYGSSLGSLRSEGRLPAPSQRVFFAGDRTDLRSDYAPLGEMLDTGLYKPGPGAARFLRYTPVTVFARNTSDRMAAVGIPTNGLTALSPDSPNCAPPLVLLRLGFLKIPKNHLHKNPVTNQQTIPSPSLSIACKPTPHASFSPRRTMGSGR